MDVCVWGVRCKILPARPDAQAVYLNGPQAFREKPHKKTQQKLYSSLVKSEPDYAMNDLRKRRLKVSVPSR